MSFGVFRSFKLCSDRAQANAKQKATGPGPFHRNKSIQTSRQRKRIFCLFTYPTKAHVDFLRSLGLNGTGINQFGPAKQYRFRFRFCSV